MDGAHGTAVSLSNFERTCNHPGPDATLRDWPRPPLIALVGNPQLRERIQVVLRLGTSSRFLGDVAYAADWCQLGDLTERYPKSPTLIDLDTEGARRPETESGGMRGGHLSSRQAVGCVSAGLARERWLNTEKSSFDTPLLRGVNDHFTALDATILGRIDAQRVRRVRNAARRVAHPVGFEILDHALDLATFHCLVPEIAVRVGRSRRTLERRCTMLGIPSPKTILSLARIYTVQRLTEWSNQPFGAVARSLGFSAASNYRRVVRATLGNPPSVIHRMGGSNFVARVILKSLG